MRIILFAVAVQLLLPFGYLVGQEQLSQAAQANVEPVQSQNWWATPVQSQLFADSDPVQTDLNGLFILALENSEQIKVFSETPLIRQTAIAEAEAAFDWTTYFNGVWDDIDEPVGSSLTVGGNADRFRDNRLSLTGGVRRRLLNGVEVDLSQRIGHQDTNSNFFIPNDQGTAELALSVNIPLLRGRGKKYNSSLFVLAGIDANVARDEFSRQLQSHLLEVARAYWVLYLERASYLQRMRLFELTNEVLNQISQRRVLDASPVQMRSVRAALSSRQADLIRSEAAIRNAETRLRALINSETLTGSENVELIPMQAPVSLGYAADMASQVEIAIQNRPEIRAATKEIKAASIRLQMTRHEVLPLLDLFTRGYLSGLRGDSQIGEAFTDQFSTGNPSYSVGISFEMPVGNRAAQARLRRRRLEQRQLQSQFRLSVENVKAEVEVAVRELSVAFREMSSRRTALAAGYSEVASLRNRFNEMVDQTANASLTLESLLRALERLADSELALAEAELTYNLALSNLNLANGSLLQAEQITVGTTEGGDLPQTIISRSN